MKCSSKIHVLRHLSNCTCSKTSFYSYYLLLQPLYSPPVWALCFRACFFKVHLQKYPADLVGQLSQAWAYTSNCVSMCSASVFATLAMLEGVTEDDDCKVVTSQCYLILMTWVKAQLFDTGCVFWYRHRIYIVLALYKKRKDFTFVSVWHLTSFVLPPSCQK